MLTGIGQTDLFAAKCILKQHGPLLAISHHLEPVIVIGLADTKVSGIVVLARRLDSVARQVGKLVYSGRHGVLDTTDSIGDDARRHESGRCRKSACIEVVALRMAGDVICLDKAIVYCSLGKKEQECNAFGQEQSKNSLYCAKFFNLLLI